MKRVFQGKAVNHVLPYNLPAHNQETDGLFEQNRSSQAFEDTYFQFFKLAESAEINDEIFSNMMSVMLSKSDGVKKMISVSFLDESARRNYWQWYRSRIKKLLKGPKVAKFAPLLKYS